MKGKNTKDTRAFPIKKGVLAKLNPNDFGAILEHIDDKLSVLIEGQGMLVSRADQTNERMDKMENRIQGMETEMRSSFKTIMKYLSRIEDELKDIRRELAEIKKGKAEQKDMTTLKDRVSKIELAVASLREELLFQKN